MQVGEVPTPQLEISIERLEKQLANANSAPVVRQALAIALVELAARPTSQLSNEQRLAQLQRAAELFGDQESVPSEALAFLAYCIAPQDSLAASEIASAAAQDYWNLDSKSRAEPARQLRVYECLLQSGNAREAQLLVGDILNATEQVSRPVLRKLITDKTAKHLLQKLFLLREDLNERGRMEIIAMLSTAMQIYSASDELQQLMIQLGQDLQSDQSRNKWIGESNSTIAKVATLLNELEQGKTLTVANLDFPNPTK